MLVQYLVLIQYMQLLHQLNLKISLNCQQNNKQNGKELINHKEQSQLKQHLVNI